MTNSPNSGQEPEPNLGQEPEPTRHRNWRSLLLRTTIIVSGIAVVGGVAAAWWAWVFIQERLAPLVENSLSQTLNRPVELGEVERFSLTGLRFDSAAIPATTTDADRVTVDAVEIGFNLIEFLTTRTLRLDVTLIRPDAFIDQAEDGTWIETAIQSQESEGPISTELNFIRVRDATVTLAPAPSVTAPTETAEDIATISPRLTFEQVSGVADFSNQNRYIAYDFRAESARQGSLRIKGETDLDEGQTNLMVQVQNLLAQDVGSLLPLPLTLEAGTTSGNLEVQFRPDQPLALFGTVRLDEVAATIQNVPNRFTEATGTLRFEEQQLAFEDFRTLYGQIPAQIGGSLNTQTGYNLTAEVPSVTANNLLETFELEFPVPVEADLQADLQLTGAIDSPLLTGTVQNLQTARIDRVRLETVRTEFALTPEALAFSDIQVVPVGGGVVAGDGRLQFGDDGGGLVFDFQGTNLPGDLIASQYGVNTENFTLGRINADAQVFGPAGALQTVVQWRAPGATYPARGEVAIAGSDIEFRDTVLQVAGGTVLARGSAQLDQQIWQAVVDATGIRLAQFSPELEGLLSGDLRLSGRTDAFSPSAIRAEGQVRLSEGIALIDRPLEAAIAWTGDRLQVQQATAPGFRASGFINARLEGEGAPEITGLNLDVSLQDYSLAAFANNLPAAVQLQGQADFTGQLTGTPAAPTAVGSLRLENLVVNNLDFDPVLTGSVRYAGGQGLNLDVAGPQDQIQVALDNRNRPVSFFIQRDEAIARGQTQGDRLVAEVRNFPLSSLNLTPATEFGLGAIGGVLNGNFVVGLADLANPSVVGEVAIAAPAIGYIDAEQFRGQIRYADGAVSLTNAELLFANSRYLITANFDPRGETVFTGQVVADEGNVQDILTALQIFDLQDVTRGFRPPTYDTAAAIDPVPVGMPEASLLTQLRRFSEIIALREQQIAAREEAEVLPELADLQGTFTGTVEVAFAPQTGPSADFSLRGENWTWDGYDVDQVIVDGSYADGSLTLLPLRLDSGDWLLAFSGSVGGEEQFGQLQAQNIPAEALQELFEFPVDVEGDLNATATLAGSLDNPQVTGEITLVDASINNAEFSGIRSIFGYSDARLNFTGQLLVDDPEPLQVAGSIPYSFPFMAVEPDSDRLLLDVDIQDEGLALLNLFTDQVTWVGGEGNVELEVRGTLREPEATGIATFDGATFTAQALPEPLTDVTGIVRFNRDVIQVERLEGDFSDGQVVAEGSIPIFNPFAAADDDPLLIALNDIALNFKGLYNGGVEGLVALGGTVLAPEIGGEILLSNGRISLPDGSEPAIEQTGGTAELTAEPSITAPPEFEDLQLTLGNNLLITREPILNFVATGDLLINGTLDDIQPEGTINLRSGQVNLFTTQFSLARGYDQTAVFTPSRGLDPFLNVRLVTSVPEVTRLPAPTSPSAFVSPEVADIPVTEFGEVRTVRIEAAVVGPASQLFDNLELTSSPPRSENEIIALLGGGFIDTLGRGDSTLALVNLAGSALLTRLQNIITNTLGVSDFRLFPTTIQSEDRTASLGIAAELGFNVTEDVSLSVLQILTADESPQFNVIYRLNDQFLLRGSTDLAGENRAVLEYELRF